jgi:uncharacterized protein
MPSLPPTVFLLPGWLDSGPTHWQSLWEQMHGDIRVQQSDWQRPLRGDWCARLDDVVANHMAASPTTAPRSIVLVAHSLGCHLVAAWAGASRHTATVRGALLVAPPDVTREDFPPDMFNWRKPILQKLPFPAICVLSSNDPFGSLAAGQATAAAWGARSVALGPFGHINGDSGLGHWPTGRALVTELIHSFEPQKDTSHGH